MCARGGPFPLFWKFHLNVLPERPLQSFHLHHSSAQSNAVPCPQQTEAELRVLPAVEEEELPAPVLLSVNEAPLEPVGGGVGDRAEPVRQPVVVQLPWRKGVTRQTLASSMLPTRASGGQLPARPRSGRGPLPRPSRPGAHRPLPYPTCTRTRSAT